MQRGNFSDAVRRISTAIEAKLEQMLKSELLKKYSDTEVASRFYKSRSDFPGRLKQYEKLSERELSNGLSEELESIRNLRHTIVHEGLHISFNDRGKAQRAVDTGGWIYEWLENQPIIQTERNKKILFQKIGHHFSIFDASISEAGVTVLKPN